MPLLRAKNEIRWLPSETVLPMKSIQRGSKIGGILVTTFGLIWCGLLIASIIAGTVKDGVNIPMTLLLLTFMLPGILFVLFGLSLLISRKQVNLERQRVTVNERSLFRTRRWAEDIKAYTGVLKQFIYHAGGGTGGSSSSTIYEVVLCHDNPYREIALYRGSRTSETVERWNVSWRRFGELLERPLLEKDAEGIVEVGPVGKTSQNKTTHNTERAVAVTPTSVDVDRRISVFQKDGAWHFSYSHIWEAWKGVLGLGVVTAMLFVGRLIQNQSPEETGIQMFFWLMWGFLGVMSLALLGYLTGVEELVVDDTRFSYRRKFLFRWTSPEWISLVSIRSIAVKKNPKRPSQPNSIVIEAPSTLIRFGTGLPNSVKLALRDVLLTMLARNRGSEFSGLAEFGTRRRVRLGARRRSLKQNVLVMGLVLPAFFAFVAVLMNIAFETRPVSAPQAVDSQYNVRPSKTVRTQHTTSKRNDRRREWIGHYNAAEKAVRQADYELAEQQFKLALKHAERFRDTDREKLSATAYYLGWVIEKQGRTLEAIPYIDKALYLKKENRQGELPLARNHLFLAKLLAKVGNSDLAEVHFGEALAIANQHLVASSTELRNFVDTYQQFLSDAGRKTEAQAFMSDSTEQAVSR